jgi:hypothetical protein
MFGDLKLELRWNFKVPYTSGLLIHLKSPKSKSPWWNFRVPHTLGVLIHLQIPKFKTPTKHFEF